MNVGWPSWKVGGSGGGLFRPTGYDGPFNQPFGGGYASPPVQGYQLPDSLNIAPMIVPHMPTNYASPTIQQQHINEGWSQPASGYGSSVVVQPSDSYYGSSTTSGAYSQPSDSLAIRPNQMSGTKNPTTSSQQVIVDPYSQVPAQNPQNSGTKNPSNSRPAQQQTSTRK